MNQESDYWKVFIFFFIKQNTSENRNFIKLFQLFNQFPVNEIGICSCIIWVLLIYNKLKTISALRYVFVVISCLEFYLVNIFRLLMYLIYVYVYYSMLPWDSTIFIYIYIQLCHIATFYDGYANKNPDGCQKC